MESQGPALLRDQEDCGEGGSPAVLPEIPEGPAPQITHDSKLDAAVKVQDSNYELPSDIGTKHGGPKQPILSNFPVTHSFAKRKTNKFNASWYKKNMNGYHIV